MNTAPFCSSAPGYIGNEETGPPDVVGQLRDAGVSWRDVGAVFASTRSGPADVFDRWMANPDTAAILERCWDGAGIAFATSSSGASYVTVLTIRR